MLQRGFSLVELSIVLVILGLLTGGILSGQSLIKAAEMRKVTTSATQLQTSIYTFRDKYMALPGDMTNAYRFWGTQAGCTDTTLTTANLTGCNGNGNGRIDDLTDGGEDLRAYQFMAYAGLIEGTYTGEPAPTGNKRQQGVNIPAAIMNRGSWWINWQEILQFGKSGNNMHFGAEGATYPIVATLSPQDLWNIDTKLDDGKPNTGAVTPLEAQTTCYSGSEYTVSTATNSCTPLFWFQ